MGELIRCSPPAAPRVEAKFPDARVAGSQWRRDGGSPRPLPTFGAAAERARVSAQRSDFSREQLGQRFAFQTPARPGKGIVFWFIGAGSFRRRESPSSVPAALAVVSDTW